MNAIFKRILDAAKLKNPGVHVYNENSLEYKFSMKFDVIVGNPPYNKGKTSGASGSGNSIWEKFLPTLWPFLNDNGYVCFVHPPEWRTNRHSAKKRKASSLMFNNQIVWLKAAFPFPGAGCSVDSYVLKKSPIEFKTEWHNSDGSIHHFLINPEMPILLNYQSTMTNQILKKLFTTQNENIFSRKAMGGLIVLNKAITGNFVLVSGARFTQKISSHPHIHQNNLKVIMSDNRDFRPIIDEGNLGIGDHVHYALFNHMQEAQWFVNLVNSRLSRFLQWIFCEGYDAKAGKHGSEPWNCVLPFTRMLLSNEKICDDATTSASYVDNYFYKFYNLTQEEIDYIEKAVA